MGTNLKINSAICTSREQSERLLALGLKKETADMMYCKTAYGEFITVKDDDYLEHLDFPAWSLHRLIGMMPTMITHEDYHLILGINATCVYYADDEYAETFKAFEGNLYDCVVKRIEWLIKEGYFNKKYLEEV